MFGKEKKTIDERDMAISEPFKFNNGDLVRDKITGFEGVVVCMSSHATYCNTYNVQPKDLDKDGKVQEMCGFDEPQLELVQKGYRKTEVLGTPFKFKPGDLVKDTMTGATGTISSIVKWFNGCNSCTIRSTSLKDGRIQETQSLDEGFLELVENTVLSVIPPVVGAPVKPEPPEDPPAKKEKKKSGGPESLTKKPMR